MPIWSGSCHCGAVRFRVEAEIDELTRCDCSLCRRRGALMAKVHEDGLTILAGEDRLTLYRWNTKVARHWFCRTCGVYPFHRKRRRPSILASTWAAWRISKLRHTRFVWPTA